MLNHTAVEKISPYRVVGAVVVTCLALALQWVLWPVFRPFIGALSYPALFLAVWIGGLWGGLLSTAVAAVIITYVFMAPELTWQVAQPRNLIAVAVFCLLGVLISITDDRLRRLRLSVVKHAEEAAQDQFRVIFDLSPIGITVADEQGVIVAANSAARRMLGYGESGLVGKMSTEIFADREITAIERASEQIAAIGSHRGDWTLVREDGTTFTAEVTSILLTDGRWQSIIRDVDAERRQQRLLHESEKRYAALTETSPDLIFMIDNEDTVRFVNAAAAHALQRTVEDLVGLKVTELFDPTTAERMLASIQHVRDTGVRITHESTASYPGGVMVMDTVLVPIEDSLGHVDCVFGVSRDITQYKEAEASLSESSKKLETALHSMIRTLGKTVEVRDPYTQGHQEGVERFSRLIAAEMGMSAEQVERIGIAALLHDVGNLAIPAEILTKPGPLSDMEFALVKRHSDAGHDILSEVDFGWPLAEIVRQTHERLDGSGYPRGLSDGDIAIEARVLMVADVIEAMTSHRPYRAACGITEALRELTEHATRYDSEVVAAVQRLHEAGELIAGPPEATTRL